MSRIQFESSSSVYIACILYSTGTGNCCFLLAQIFICSSNEMNYFNDNSEDSPVIRLYMINDGKKVICFCIACGAFEGIVSRVRVPGQMTEFQLNFVSFSFEVFYFFKFVHKLSKIRTAIKMNVYLPWSYNYVNNICSKKKASKNSSQMN